MKKTTEIYASEIRNKWNLNLTSEYLGAHSVVSFECPNGHSNEATATNLLQRGYKCKECITGYKVESKIKWTTELVEKLVETLKTNSTADTAKLFSTTESAINNVLAKNDISNPSDRLAEVKLLEVLKLQGREILSDFKGSSTLVTVKCSKGHIATQQASNIISHNTNCPKCFSIGISNQEQELYEFIKSIYSGWIEPKDRTILEGKELDIVLPDLGIAIEYNGTYWHNEEKVGKLYHKNKTDSVETIGYQLLHIKDYDWIYKREIVKSIIRSKLGITNKIYARKCKLKSINFPKEFLDTNHIQGAGQPTSINYGLFLNEELIAVATFGKPRYDKQADLELIRYCSKLNTTVTGGLSRLLKQVSGKIISYANRDYSIGKAYTKVGFKLDRVTDPGLEYYKRGVKLSRYKAQSMPEEELVQYVKYYNSGNLVFYKN